MATVSLRPTLRFDGTLAEGLLLWAVILFSAAAALGFAIFGVRPELLAAVPWSIPFFTFSFRLFSIGQIVLAAGALMVLLLLRESFRWIPAFLTVYVISLASELSGTQVGFPFGPYHYTPTLGARWFDLVPVVIPLSWFMMAIPSYFLALRITPDRGPVVRIALGALILTAWDLALDPAMSYATTYWRWEVDGLYYGMPWVNVAGWLFTSTLLMIALFLLRSDEWISRLPGSWVLVFYGVNVLLPLAMALAAGLFWAVALTVAAYALLVGIAWLLCRDLLAEPVTA